tara:strand:- start:385 stop:561 length:177 start_codon:yes stop_codon:yes gene_type:complete
MNENTTQEPMIAELVSVKLTAQELEQLRRTGSIQVSNNEKPKFKLPEGPMFLNGQWHC